MSTVDPAAVTPSPTTSSSATSSTFTSHSSTSSEQAMSLVVQLGATACSNNMISSQQASPLPATAVTSPDKNNQYPSSAELGFTSESKDVTASAPAATIVVTSPFQNILKKSPLIISNNSTTLPAKIHTINTSNGQQRLQTLNVQRTSVGTTASPSAINVAATQLTQLGTSAKVQVLSNVVLPKNYIINKNVVNPTATNPQRQILNHVNPTKHIVTNALGSQKTALNILTSKVVGATTAAVPTNSKPQILNNMVLTAPKGNYITATASNQLLNNGTTRTTIVNNAKVVPQAHVISRVISNNSKPSQTSPTNNQFIKNSTIVVQKNTHPSPTSSTPTLTTPSKTNSAGVLKAIPSSPINHLQKLQNTTNRMSNNVVVQQRGLKTLPPQRPVTSISSGTFTKSASKPPSTIKGSSLKTSPSGVNSNTIVVSRGQHLLTSPKSKQVVQINQQPSPVPAGTRLVTTQSGNVLTTGNVLKYQGQQFQVIHAPSPPNFASAQLSPQIQVANPTQTVQPMTVVRTVASYEDNNVPVGIASALFSPNLMVSKDRDDQEISQDNYLSEDDIISEVRPDYSTCTNPVLFDHNYHLPPPDSPPPSPKKSNLIESSVQSNISQISPNYIFAKSPGRLTNSLSGSHLDLLHEDDAASTISSDTGREVEPEGEETETAPEGEGEEDSVTRCICDFEHDDGYMICCDKCFVWQHVDCMFIDRQNIQEEYLCERCEPRRVDRQRARAIQLRKREELLNTGSSSDTSSGSSTLELAANTGNQPVANTKKRGAPPTPNVGRRKNLDSGPKNRTSSNLPATTTNQTQRRSRRDSNRDPPPTSKAKLVNSATIKQRRQERKVPMKRKTKTRRSQEGGNDDSQESWERGGASSASVNQLRSWIENYEEAVTNHYSPELRARIIKAGAHNHQNSDSKSNLHSMAQASANIHKCRTVQQVTLGTKILVSTMFLSAQTPIIELRGKYMLNSPLSSSSGNANHHQNVAGRPHAQKPGPFLFFYRLQKDNVDVCVDTRTYGNDARFVRRSCKPNAEVRHCIEKGTLHLYLVSLADIDKNTELTIKHDATTVPPVTPCACGNSTTCTVASPQVNQSRSNSTSSNPSSIVTRRSNGAVHDLVELSTQRKRRGRRTTSSSDVELPSPTPSSLKTPVNIPPPPEPVTIPVTTPPITTTVQTIQPPITTTHTTTTQATTTITSSTTTITSPTQTGPVRRRSQNSRALTTNPTTPTVKSEDKPELTVQVTEKTEDIKDKKKMTREEKKMEAIIKAFERMEKQQQRKQESKSRQTHRRESDPVSTPQYNDSNSSNERAKKKRKGRARTTSTNSNSNSATNRRRARLNSTDSHLTSGDDNSLMSPPLPVNDEANITQIHTNDITINNNNISMNHLENGDNDTSDENQTDDKTEGDMGTEGRAADLLLALANGGHNTEDSLKSPIRDTDACSSAGSVHSSPGTLLSSNCLLVAAAVEQITPGFKFPKTKKAIMNEWLNKSPEPIQPASAISPMSLQASRALEFPSPLSVTTNSLESTSSNNCRQSLASLVHATNVCSTSPPISKLAGGNAKKRWLRQAISEECDSPNSRPESPHAEMIAPPKKRRMARESSESFTPPTTPTRSNHPNISDDYENEHYINNDEEYYAEDKVKSEFTEENQKSMDVDTETYSNALINGHDLSNPEPDVPSKEMESDDLERSNRIDEFNAAPTSHSLDPRLRYENSNCLGRVEESLQFLESWGCTPKPEAITPAKRKLSISEYRQRKQQVVSTSSNATMEKGSKTTPSGSNSGSSTIQNVSDCSTGGSNSPRPNARLRTNSASSGTSSLSSDDEQKDPVTTPLETPEKEKVPGLVAFDSTPTLVERQRENLTARLKREFGLFLQDEEDSKKTTASITDGLLSHRLGLRTTSNSFINSSVPTALDEKPVNNIGLSKWTTSLDDTVKNENKSDPPFPSASLNDTKSNTISSSFDSITPRSKLGANNNTTLSNGTFKNISSVNFITPFDNPVYPNTTYYTGFPLGKSPYSSSLVTTSNEIDGVTGSKSLYSSPLNKLSSRK